VLSLLSQRGNDARMAVSLTDDGVDGETVEI